MNTQEYVNKYKDIKIVWYRSAISIFKAWRWPDCYEPDTVLQPYNGSTQVSITQKEWLKRIRAVGFWGYASPDKQEIHIWVNPKKVDAIEKAFLVIGHELGHLMEPRYKNPISNKEEDKANAFGFVSMLAAQMIKDRGLITNKEQKNGR